MKMEMEAQLWRFYGGKNRGRGGGGVESDLRSISWRIWAGEARLGVLGAEYIATAVLGSRK